MSGDVWNNEPSWPGAATAYARANRITSAMARNGHVKPAVDSTKRRPRVTPSQDLTDAIDMLNEGNEERIKGFVLANLRLLSAADLAETGGRS